MNSILSWLTYSSQSLHDKVLLALSPSTALYQWYTSNESKDDIVEAPAIVSTMPGISLLNQIRATIRNDKLIQKGYEQHKDDMFRMPFMGSWVTVVSGKYATEIVRAPDTVLSFQETLNTMLNLDITMGPEIARDMIHLPVIRALTRNLEAIYPEIMDETKFTLSEQLRKEKKVDGWITVDVNTVFFKVVGQINHRAFVGLPLCRDEEWAKVMTRCQIDFTLRGLILKAFPKSKRQDASTYLAEYGSAWAEGIRRLTPVIEERRNMTGELPNDLLTWIMTRVPGEQPALHVMINLFQLIDLVAQITTAMTFIHALLYVATYPEDVEQLREEILEVTTIEGFSKKSLDKMPKLDSFLHETMRLSGISNGTLNRVALQDFTFSNGVRIPKGGIIQAVANPLHHDSRFYPRPKEFLPWRYYELAQQEHKGSKRYDSVTPSEEYLAWGRGKHACPGRWYAVMVIKHLLAYLIIHYDIKLEDSAKGKRPQDFPAVDGVFPNRKAKIKMRKREDVSEDGSVFLK